MADSRHTNEWAPAIEPDGRHNTILPDCVEQAEGRGCEIEELGGGAVANANSQAPEEFRDTRSADEPTIVLGIKRSAAIVARDHLAPFLGIRMRRELRRFHQVAETAG
jgi:hypothetical protein